MASGRRSRETRRPRPSSLNSCSGEVWPRGSAVFAPAASSAIAVSILVLVKYGLGACEHNEDRPRAEGLNSCSGEVWPRGVRRAAARGDRGRVSILVLVKYGLGGAD